MSTKQFNGSIIHRFTVCLSHTFRHSRGVPKIRAAFRYALRNAAGILVTPREWRNVCERHTVMRFNGVGRKVLVLKNREIGGSDCRETRHFML